MTKSPSDQTILVSGASGFLATQVIKAFLEKGYNVRGTVRSIESAQACRDIFPNADDKQLSFVIVKDMAAPNAFHEAVTSDIDGVMHTASPFTFSVEDNEKDLLLPAINGTLNMLKAVKDNAPNVKRVVCTSSFAASVDVTAGYRAGYTYTEDDWNPCSYEEAAKKDTDGGIAYCASKALAEKAAWDFMKDNSNVGFDLVMINPVYILGKVDQSIKGMDRLNQSAADLYRYMDGSHVGKAVDPAGFPIFVDVVDCAEGHLRAYEIPEAGGKRFLFTSDNFCWEETVHVLQSIPGLAGKLPKVPDKSEYVRPDMYKVSNDKAKTVLGMEFKGLEQTITQMAMSLLEKEKMFED